MIALAVVLALAVAAGAWIGVRAMMAKSELEAILPLAQPVQDAVEARDFGALDDLVVTAQGHASAAAGLTSDPVWRAAEIIPVLGQNLAAVRTVSSALDGMAGSARPLLAIVDGVDGSATGGLDLTVFEEAQEPLAAASSAFADADAALKTLDRSGLLSPVADAVGKADEIVGEAAPAMAGIAQASLVLPTMLGADGPRTVLVMMQNSAELRTGGGLTGSFILLGADAGRIEILGQADSSDFAPLDESPSIVPASAIDVYGQALGRWVQNTSMTADFTLTAALASQWWQSHSGSVPDAILSLDLTTVAALLSTADAVTLPDGTEITRDNLLDRVLVEPYFTMNQSEQTRFQSMVTSAAMNSIVHSDIDPFAWMQALSGPISEGRVSAWSSVPEEQAVIAGSPLQGPSGRLAAAGDHAFGVYFNDETAGKMDSFLEASIASGSSSCRPDGATDVRIEVTLTNTADAGAASWPMSMTGGGSEGVAPGDIGTSISVAAPKEAVFEGVWVDGSPVQLDKGEDAGFATNRARLTVAPGESKTAEFRLVVDASADEDPTILHTPLLITPRLSTIDVACS